MVIIQKDRFVKTLRGFDLRKIKISYRIGLEDKYVLFSTDDI